MGRRSAREPGRLCRSGTMTAGGHCHAERPAMTSGQLRQTRDALPFRPVVIHLADGRSFRVPHRDYVSISPAGRTVIVYGPGEAFDILDILLVTGLAVEDVVPQSGGV